MLSSNMTVNLTSNVTLFKLICYLVAMDRANGRKVDGRRVVVDYERGRTKKEWVPRRLGGGKGDKRRDRDTDRLIRELIRTDPKLKSRSRSKSPVVNEAPVQVKEEVKQLEPTDSKKSDARRSRSPDSRHRHKHSKHHRHHSSKKESKREHESRKD